jgi:hypothetical protein
MHYPKTPPDSLNLIFGLCIYRTTTIQLIEIPTHIPVTLQCTRRKNGETIVWTESNTYLREGEHEFEVEF